MKKSTPRYQNNLLVNLIKTEKYRYLLSTLALMCAVFLAFLVPYISKVVIDYVITDSEVVKSASASLILKLMGGQEYLSANLWIAGLAIVLVTLISGIFMFVRDYLSASACEETVRDLRNRLYEHLHRLPNQYHTNADSGDLLQRCTSDIDTLREFLTTQVMNIGRTVILVIIVVPLMFKQHVQMSLISLGLVPVVIVFAYYFFERVKALFTLVDEAEGELTTIVQENLTGIRVVRAFARQEFESAKFAEKNHKYSELNYKLICMLADFWSTSDFLCIFQTGVVLIVGGWLASTGSISIGTFVAFIMYTSMIIWPIRELGKELSEAGRATVAIGRIQEILNQSEEPETKNPIPLPLRLKGDIEFRQLFFEYAPGIPILKGLSFQIHAGETIAIVGPTGAGKSTMIQLLLRLYDYEQGSITLDGIELSSVDRQDVRAQVGTLQQEPFLFSRSLRENIKLSNHDATNEQMIEATSAASVHETIESFENGYETVIGERGVNLSGGQRQRVTLSRTLLKTPPILILDDTLSAVDSDTEQKIIKALHRKKGEQTLLIITHRMSVCEHADRILVLQDGELAQQGTHTELIATTGFYQDLWHIQAGQETVFLNDLKKTG